MICASVLIGCTSILGSFDVASGPTPGGDDGGGDTSSCTQCNGTCVDLATNTLNCGACGIACLGGQQCSASKCACPKDQAFCNGNCTHADRNHCGATCQQCQNDQICIGECKVAPPPTFDKTPLDPTGWKDSANNPIAFTIHDVGPGTTYECRTGPKATMTATTPPFAPCDGGAGTGIVYKPVEDAVTPEGTYRTEMRYRNDTYKSDVVGYDFYVHHHLDGVPSCPKSAADGPHFTDADYFKAASDYQMAKGDFDINTNFPALGASPSDAFWLHNPFIKIPFQGVTVAKHMLPAATGGWGAPPFVANFTVSELTLRHKFIMNPTHTMILVRRQYEQPKKHDCKNAVRIGTRFSKKVGPDGLTPPRGEKYFDCEAFVLNVHGQALCMGKNAAGTAPEPMVIDQNVDQQSGQSASYTTAAAIAAGATTVTTNGFPWSAAYVGSWIQLPPNVGHWYQVSALNSCGAFPYNGCSISVTPALMTNVPAGTQLRYNSSKTPTSRVVIPTGYAHLYQNQHKVVPPSQGTKCTTLGCADGRPWLTYLPP